MLQEGASCLPLDEVPPTCGGEAAPDCLPARSPTYCSPQTSFDSLIGKRHTEVTNDPLGVYDAGYWFHLLDDKAAAYIHSASAGHAPPAVICCVTDPSDLASDDCALDEPVVIKAADLHSNDGIFVFPSGVDPNTPSPELLSGSSMTLVDVIASLYASDGGSKILVEEFVDNGGDLPTEYKVHAFDGQVAAIDVIANRGTECACYAVFDVTGDRLDTYGKCLLPLLSISCLFGHEASEQAPGFTRTIFLCILYWCQKLNYLTCTFDTQDLCLLLLW